MYHKGLTIDGQQVTIDQVATNSGARFVVRVPGNAPPTLTQSVLSRTQDWCDNRMADISGSTIRARQDRNAVEVEALGANWQQLEEGFPALEEELMAPTPATHQPAGMG